MTHLKVVELLDTTHYLERKIGVALMYSALRLPQYRAMLFLETLGKITVSDLSKHMNVTRATISVLVNELVRADIVECLDNRADKRSFYLRLTDSGLQRLALAKSEVSMVAANIASELTEDTLKALNDFACGVQRGR